MKSFKCPNYYCVHWRYVCDGYWDCPFGLDELSCHSMPKRQGFFHCVDSAVYILPISICDGINDCPQSDDEFSCEQNTVLCPASCLCILYTLICRNAGFLGFVSLHPFWYVSLAGNIACSMFWSMATLFPFIYQGIIYLIFACLWQVLLHPDCLSLFPQKIKFLF